VLIGLQEATAVFARNSHKIILAPQPRRLPATEAEWKAAVPLPDGEGRRDFWSDRDPKSRTVIFQGRRYSRRGTGDRMALGNTVLPSPTGAWLTLQSVVPGILNVTERLYPKGIRSYEPAFGTAYVDVFATATGTRLFGIRQQYQEYGLGSAGVSCWCTLYTQSWSPLLLSMAATTMLSMRLGAFWLALSHFRSVRGWSRKPSGVEPVRAFESSTKSHLRFFNVRRDLFAGKVGFRQIISVVLDEKNRLSITAFGAGFR
jgi:hypothetical protein